MKVGQFSLRDYLCRALERYRQAQPVRVSKSAVLEAALKRFLLQEGYLSDDEPFSESEERELLAAKDDDYISLDELKTDLRG
jgi:hypothetical protein